MSAQQSAPTPLPQAQPTTPTSSSSGGSSSGSVQLKRAVAGRPLDVQLSMLAPVQRKGGEDTAAVHDAAAAGIASGGGALPHADKIQASFGAHDVSNVQAHTGSAASQASAAMGAEAYATGNHVAFGGAPDLHTAAHEAAHVVQQQAGVSLSGGVGQVGDSYEQHADAVADAVVQGKSAEGLLSKMTGGTPAGGVQRSVQRRAVQREETPPGPAPDSAPGGGARTTPAEGAPAARSPGDAPANAAPTDPTMAKTQAFDAEKATALARADGIQDPGGIKAFLSSLPATATHAESGYSTPFASDQGLANVMIGKLETAMTESRAAWAEEDQGRALEGKPPTGPDKEKAFITDRLNLLKSAAPAGIKKTLNGASVLKPPSIKDFFWNIVASNWDICAPEEEAGGELLDSIGGVYKAFDAGDFWSKMDADLQNAWAAHGGQAAWINALTNGARVPVAPPGLEGDPDFKPFVDGAKVAFPGTVSGFISTANAMKNAQIIAADKAKVIKLLALQGGRYPSAKMFLASMGSAGAGAARTSTAGAAKPARLGKPSMFYLIAFPENVYVASNRDHGMTAGDEPELQATNMPAQAFLDGNLMVKS